MLETRLLSNLRGHKVGVTAVCEARLKSKVVLISGDQDGSLILWDLLVMRHMLKYYNLFDSRIQSLRTIALNIRNSTRDLLIVQTRDQGVHLLDLTDSANVSQTKPLVVREFPTYEALFSRGDAISISSHRAILAYPSALDAHTITIRFLSEDAETTSSGSALRNNHKRSPNTCSVFDIRIRQLGDNYHIFAGYEDGHICCFIANEDRTTTVPELDVTGLKLECVLDCDTLLGDFISAFDILSQHSGYKMICGASKKDIVILDVDQYLKHSTSGKISLKSQGVSATTNCPSSFVTAVATWDNQIHLVDLENLTILRSLDHHLNQVQDVTFICKNDVDMSHSSSSSRTSVFYMCSASLDGTISMMQISLQP